MKKLPNNQKGYIALVAVLIIVMVTLGIGLSLNTLSIGESQSGLVIQQSVQSQAISDSCLQEALWQLRQDVNYSGGNLNIGFGSCNITVVPQGADHLVTVEASVSGVISKSESNITVSNGNIVLNSWQISTN